MSRSPRLPAGLAPAALAALLLAGCAGSPDGAAEADRPLTVLAASSLTDAFERLGEQFAAANPGVEVRLSLGASSALAQQVVAGARADVLAAAGPASMATAVEAGSAVDPRAFARNSLEIAVPPGNPGGVTGLADFARPELTLALCAEQVPCGAAARELLAAAGITPAPDTLERDVRAALAKVQLGEVDAALVYTTDVLAAGERVRGVPVAGAGSAVTEYLIAPLAQAPNPEAARAFTAYVLSADGQRVLADAGFAAP